jgi:hypothetical protein
MNAQDSTLWIKSVKDAKGHKGISKTREEENSTVGQFSTHQNYIPCHDALPEQDDQVLRALFLF